MQKQFLQEATLRYANSLRGSPAGEYLNTRGLLAPSIDRDPFLFGYVANPLPGHEMFRGWLSIPYLRRMPGRPLTVVSIRFRCIEDHEHEGHGKYMTLPGDRPRLYNTVDLLDSSPTICIVEGELDAATLRLCGIRAVGVPGAENWLPHFPEPFRGYETVYAVGDGDDAGQRFTRTVVGGVKGKIPPLANGKIIPFAPGEDANSIYVSQGRDALLERFK
nr:topoisomerase [Nocardia cyriacigeorgica]